MNSASASSFPVASLDISTCVCMHVCVCVVRDSEGEGQAPLSRPSAWQAELSHTISRFVGSTHHCFPIPETQRPRECVYVCVSLCIWTWTHTPPPLLILGERRNQILILQRPPGIEKKKWVDLPFCYWFHENEFHRLSLRCLHSQKLWNQILCREKQRREGGRERGREWVSGEP